MALARLSPDAIVSDTCRVIASQRFQMLHRKGVVLRKVDHGRVLLSGTPSRRSSPSHVTANSWPLLGDAGVFSIARSPSWQLDPFLPSLSRDVCLIGYLHGPTHTRTGKCRGSVNPVESDGDVPRGPHTSSPRSSKTPDKVARWFPYLDPNENPHRALVRWAWADSAKTVSPEYSIS